MQDVSCVDQLAHLHQIAIVISAHVPYSFAKGRCHKGISGNVNRLDDGDYPEKMAEASTTGVSLVAITRRALGRCSCSGVRRL